MNRIILYVILALLFYAALPPNIQTPIRRIGGAAGNNIRRTVNEVQVDPNLPECSSLVGYSEAARENVESAGMCR